MADPLAVVVARQFQDDLKKQESKAQAIMARRWLYVEDLLSDQIEALAAYVHERYVMGDPVPDWKIYQLQRYRSLLAQIQVQLATFTGQAQQDIEGLTAAARDTAVSHVKKSLEAFGEKKLAAQLGFDRLGQEAAEKIAGLAQAGQPLDLILSQAYPIGAATMTRQLITGAALGWNPRKTARLMAQGFRASFNHILLVARDQQIRNYRETTRDGFKTAGVQRYKRLAARNKRTCMACIALDGTEYDTAELMALHPQDRCVMIPIIEGYPEPVWPSAREWFRQQPEDVQKDMMGKKKHALWQDGAFSLRDLATIKPNNVWGPSAQVTTLKDLTDGKGGITPKGDPKPPPPTPVVQKTDGSRSAEEARKAILGIPEETNQKALDLREEQRQWDIKQDDARRRLRELAARFRSEKLPHSEWDNHPEWVAVNDEIDTAVTNALDITKEIGDLLYSIQTRQREVLYLPEDQQTAYRPVYQSGVDKKRKGKWQLGADEFRKMVSKDLLGPVDIPFYVRAGKRAKDLRLGTSQRSCHYKGELFLGTYAGAGTVVHEAGHALELHNPFVHDQAVRFWAARTAGEEAQPLSKLNKGQGYGPGEWAKPDKFKDAYVGKIYGYNVWKAGKWRFDPEAFAADDDTGNYASFRSSEIVSMGIEYMWTDPESFARDDPDYFDFIYDLMRGRGR